MSVLRHRLRLEILESRCLLTTVTNVNDAGPGSLRQAIIDTPNGGTIDFQLATATGTIDLTSGELHINKDLTITATGSEVNNVITVTRDPNAPTPFRIFEIDPGKTVTLKGLWITQGLLDYNLQHGDNVMGAGILNHGNLTLTFDNVRDNVLNDYLNAYGAGVYNDGTLRVLSSAVQHNFITYADLNGFQAEDGAGIAMFGDQATLYATDANISDNHFGDNMHCQPETGRDGSRNCGPFNPLGIAIYDGTTRNTTANLTIIRSFICYNGSPIGDPFAINTSGGITMDYATVFNNTGGGVYVLAPQAPSVITKTTISGTTVDPALGVVDTQLTLQNSTIDSNQSALAGAGITMSEDAADPAYIVNCTVSRNSNIDTYSGDSNAGGILATSTGGSIYLLNTIVWGNTVSVHNSQSDDNVYDGHPDAIVSEGHNLIGPTSSTPWDTTKGDQVGVVDAKLDPLGDYGGLGTWPTHPYTVRLQLGSPAIDAGDDQVVNPNDPPQYYVGQTDERGDGYPRLVGAHVDVGAFERNAADGTPPSSPLNSGPSSDLGLAWLPRGRTNEFGGKEEGVGGFAALRPPESYELSLSLMPPLPGESLTSTRPSPFGRQLEGAHVHEAPWNLPDVLPDLVGKST